MKSSHILTCTCCTKGAYDNKKLRVCDNVDGGQKLSKHIMVGDMDWRRLNTLMDALRSTQCHLLLHATESVPVFESCSRWYVYYSSTPF